MGTIDDSEIDETIRRSLVIIEAADTLEEEIAKIRIETDPLERAAYALYDRGEYAQAVALCRTISKIWESARINMYAVEWSERAARIAGARRRKDRS